jgi:transcription initiation factor TFIID subunit 2
VPAKPPERNELVTTEIKLDHTPEDARLLQQALAEVDRYRSMDRLIPSFHNVVTLAAVDVSGYVAKATTGLTKHLQFYLLLSLADLIPSDPRTFFPLTRYDYSIN